MFGYFNSQVETESIILEKRSNTVANIIFFLCVKIFHGVTADILQTKFYVFFCPWFFCLQFLCDVCEGKISKNIYFHLSLWKSRYSFIRIIKTRAKIWKITVILIFNFFSTFCSIRGSGIFSFLPDKWNNQLDH